MAITVLLYVEIIHQSVLLISVPFCLFEFQDQVMQLSLEWITSSTNSYGFENPVLIRLGKFQVGREW